MSLWKILPKENQLDDTTLRLELMRKLANLRGDLIIMIIKITNNITKAIIISNNLVFENFFSQTERCKVAGNIKTV